MNANTNEAVAEAIMFATGEPVSAVRMARVLECSEKEARGIVEGLKKRYEEEGRGIQIVKIGNGYQMCTKPELYEYLVKVECHGKKPVFTDTLMETLSIIAYKQPVTKLGIEKIRGVKSDHAVNKLIEYQLVCEKGRLDIPGKPILFGTTDEFLRVFSLSAISDLPRIDMEKIREMEEKIYADNGGDGDIHVEV